MGSFDSFDWLFRLWQAIKEAYLVHLPLGCIYKFPTPEITVKIQNLLPSILSNRPRYASEEDPLIDALDDFAAFVNDAASAGGREGITMKDRDYALGLIVHWWACEAVVDELAEERGRVLDWRYHGGER